MADTTRLRLLIDAMVISGRGKVEIDALLTDLERENARLHQELERRGLVAWERRVRELTTEAMSLALKAAAVCIRAVLKGQRVGSPVSLETLAGWARDADEAAVLR